jgi:hypothetical protein
VSDIVINNNSVSSITNNNIINNYSESDDVSFKLSPDDEDTTDTEEILVSQEKDYKVEPVKDKRKIMEIANKTNNRNNKIVKVLVEDADEDDDNEISDKISLYSRLVINNGVSGLDTSSVNSIRTANLSVFSAKMYGRNISVPDIQSQKEISKIQKHPVHQFYNDSYYLVIHNKTNYYPDENHFTIYAN